MGGVEGYIADNEEQRVLHYQSRTTVLTARYLAVLLLLLLLLLPCCISYFVTLIDGGFWVNKNVGRNKNRS